MGISHGSAFPKTVLFVCQENACRSQIAAAIFNRMANPEIVRAVCAGLRPARFVHPKLKSAMREIGIDLRDPVPRLVSPDRVGSAHLLITMGCADACPAPATIPRDDWFLPDSAGPSIDDLRKIRVQIESRVRSLIAAHPWE